MDYKFIQLLTTIGMILCVMNAIGCINYLSIAFTGFSMIQGVTLQTIFGISGVILLVATIIAYEKIESSI